MERPGVIFERVLIGGAFTFCVYVFVLWAFTHGELECRNTCDSHAQFVFRIMPSPITYHLRPYAGKFCFATCRVGSCFKRTMLDAGGMPIPPTAEEEEEALAKIEAGKRKRRIMGF